MSVRKIPFKREIENITQGQGLVDFSKRLPHNMYTDQNAIISESELVNGFLSRHNFVAHAIYSTKKNNLIDNSMELVIHFHLKRWKFINCI